MTTIRKTGQMATLDADDSTRRNSAKLGEGARAARGDMTRILRALMSVRADASTCSVLHLDERGRAVFVGRLLRVQESLVELERALAQAARYFDEAASAFEAEGV